MSASRHRSLTSAFFLSMAFAVVLSGVSVCAIWVLDAYGPSGGVAGIIVKSLLVLAGCLCITVFIVRSIAGGIDKSLDALLLFFDKAADKPAEIDENEVLFREFSTLALAANDLVGRCRRAEETSKKVEQENIRLKAMLRQSQKTETVGTLEGGTAHDATHRNSEVEHEAGRHARNGIEPEERDR
jgi:hypothetical protein